MSVSFEINTSNGPAVNSPYGPVLLSDLFELDAERGTLIWRRRSIGLFPSKKAFAVWNAQRAGASALAVRDSTAYRVGDIFGRKTLAHRVIFAIHNGQWPVNHVDHINGAKSDNRAVNLRDVSRIENSQNASIRVDNASGISGVNWDKKRQRWRAKIGSGGGVIISAISTI